MKARCTRELQNYYNYHIIITLSRYYVKVEAQP